MEVVAKIKQNDPTEKTIIFSQFTSLLDLLEVPLTKTGINYRRYDGGMSSTKRNQALLDFQDDNSITVLIVSLKAGNSGLNLVAASQVIIFGMPVIE
jgi:SNF2 family DNA or RNA helicase